MRGAAETLRRQEQHLDLALRQRSRAQLGPAPVQEAAELVPDRRQRAHELGARRTALERVEREHRDGPVGPDRGKGDGRRDPALERRIAQHEPGIGRDVGRDDRLAALPGEPRLALPHAGTWRRARPARSRLRRRRARSRTPGTRAPRRSRSTATAPRSGSPAGSRCGAGGRPRPARRTPTRATPADRGVHTQLALGQALLGDVLRDADPARRLPLPVAVQPPERQELTHGAVVAHQADAVLDARFGHRVRPLDHLRQHLLRQRSDRRDGCARGCPPGCAPPARAGGRGSGTSRPTTRSHPCSGRAPSCPSAPAPRPPPAAVPDVSPLQPVPEPSCRRGYA